MSGLYFDGKSAEARPVSLTIDRAARALVLSEATGVVAHWPLDLIRRLPDQAGRDEVMLRLRDDPLARLLTAETELLAACPHLSGSQALTNRWRLGGWALAAVASVALILFVLIPAMADQLARFIPPAGERALGRTTLEQIRDALDDSGLAPVAVCETPDGRAALSRMEARLKAAMPEPVEVDVTVLDHPMVNAFALPGAQIVLFRGLLATAEDPDEIAAVLAHELGHVVSRDPTRHALRSAGSLGVLGLLFGDFAGGTMVLLLTEKLIRADYSREAEIAADAYAREVLERAQIAPSALGTMFVRMLAKSGDASPMAQHFSDHPTLASRIKKTIKLPAPKGARAVLTQKEWSALKGICD